MNRRSWEASKLSSQIEEEEPTEKSQDDTLQVDQSPKLDVKSKSPAVNKKYDEKEGGMFSKLKYFRKGNAVPFICTLFYVAMNNEITNGPIK